MSDDKKKFEIDFDSPDYPATISAALCNTIAAKIEYNVNLECILSSGPLIVIAQCNFKPPSGRRTFTYVFDFMEYEPETIFNDITTDVNRMHKLLDVWLKIQGIQL